MARPRKNHTQDEDTIITSEGNEFVDEKVAAHAAIAQPTPVLAGSGHVDSKALLASFLGINISDLNTLTKAKEEASIFAMAAQAKEYADAMRSKKENDAIRDWTQKSAQERTQEIADREWGSTPDAVKYRVSIPSEPSQLTLLIAARSPEEAQGRYSQLCGIRSTDHAIKVSRLVGPAARKKTKKVEVEAVESEAEPLETEE